MKLKYQMFVIRGIWMLSPRGETCVCFLLEEHLFIPVALAKT